LDDSLRYVQRHLTHVFPTGVKPVFRLTLASGKTIRATENHPFLAYEGWTQLGDLRTGSRVAVPRHVPAPHELTTWQDEKVVLLAHMLGDGSFVKKQPIRYASIDEQNLGAVTKAAMVFGVAAGVGAILNFAPTVVVVPAEVSLRKVDLATELQILSFYQQHRRRALDRAPV